MAGNADYFQNLIILLKPDEWKLDFDERLFFLGDAHGVIQWRLELPSITDDPLAWDYDSGMGGEPCSKHLVFWLYYAATLGQKMPFAAEVMNDLDQSTFNFMDSTWNLLIKHCEERVYNRSGRVIYLSPYGSNPNIRWHMWVGVTEHQMLDEISRELGVVLTNHQEGYE